MTTIEPPFDAVVTGAASGIGLATARRVQREGRRVLAVDLDAEGLERASAEGMATMQVDLSSAADRDRLVEVAQGCRYLVNSAGILVFKPILDVTVDDLRFVYAVNVDAVWDLCSRIGRTMPDGGAIVNLSSSAAKFANTNQIAPYASSKAAVLSITRSFAQAFSPQGVRVNAICPGVIETPMQDDIRDRAAEARGMTVEQLEQVRTASIPLGRAGTPDECAGAIWFLLSDEAAYMTGQGINFTGGQVTW
jgi:NAD(P)-dependent dehydrogenase (short-subunit alcohol dehydrogenase family)